MGAIIMLGIRKYYFYMYIYLSNNAKSIGWMVYAVCIKRN